MYEGIVTIFSRIPDPRQGNGIVYQDLTEILVVAILAVLCGAEAFTHIELFGREKEEWLRTFLKLENGIPSHDTFGDIFAAVDANMVSEAFAKWVKTIQQKISGEVVAIDGKSICASKDIPKNKKAIHVVSAWAAQNKLVLGQLATEEKSNEITAIPKLLDLLEIKGCIVTIDAMGTQTTIADKIVEKGADYILVVKENQPTLLNDIELYFETQSKHDEYEQASTKEKSHGRFEQRELVISRDIGWLDPEGRWKGLAGIGRLTSKTESLSTGKTEISTQYLIFSCPTASAEQILSAKRTHWSVENSLHWRLDVVYNEDNCRVRSDNAGIVFNIFRHLSLNLLSQDGSFKGGLKAKQLRCALSTPYLEKIIGIS